jgi:hypothetical protein
MGSHPFHFPSTFPSQSLVSLLLTFTAADSRYTGHKSESEVINQKYDIMCYGCAADRGRAETQYPYRLFLF